MLLLRPLDTLEPRVEVILPVVVLVVLLDATEAGSLGIWQITHDFLVILISWLYWRNLQFDNMATHAERQFALSSSLLLLDLACRRGGLR